MKSKNSETRNKLLLVAENNFASKGYGIVNLHDIAVETGIAKSTLFHYFKTKQDLFQAIIRKIFFELKQLLRDEQKFIQPTKQDQIRSFFREFLRWLKANPDRAKIIVRVQLDYPDQSRKLAKKFWGPVIHYISCIVKTIRKDNHLDIEMFVLEMLNSMINFVYSFNSHLFLVDQSNIDDLFQRFEKHIIFSVDQLLLEN